MPKGKMGGGCILFMKKRVKNNYINYHKHTSFSNISSPDSVVTTDDYINRAKELGHSVVTSVEHGNQGNWLEVYDKCKENDLKFVAGAEAYFVLDEKEKDNTNCHIVLLAKNEKGRRELNLALSKAQKDGYYYKPRLGLEQVGELDNVMITSACVQFANYGKEITESIVQSLKDKDFYLEVQYHHTDKQREHNQLMLDMAEKYDVPLIAGMDSHYINHVDIPENIDVPKLIKRYRKYLETGSCGKRDKAIFESDWFSRQLYIKSKGLKYPVEKGWFMDYPSREVAEDRFKEQGVLTDGQIKESLDNTLVVEDFEDIYIDDNFKVPNIHKDKTEQERKDMLTSICYNNNEHEDEGHLTAIEEELEVVNGTGMQDYFLMNYEVVKEGKDNGGKLTLTSRGSAPSYYINRLLGFTTIDRVDSPIELYPERFLAKERVLSGSVPDIDLNVANPDIFIKAQKKLLGEESTYYMAAPSYLKPKSAFKRLATAINLDFKLANDISSKYDSYEEDKKYNDDANIEEYMSKEELRYFNAGKRFEGAIDNVSSHACGVTALNGDVREELGIVKTKSKYVCCIDGSYLEKYGYLKNDWLKVDVVDIIHGAFDRMGIDPIPFPELLEKVKNNKEVWETYHKGMTVGQNQVETDGTIRKVMRYKPSNFQELSAFIAGIRPSFKSLYNKFESREKFEYGVEEFDNLIQTPEMPNSFILYQEQIMKSLKHAGIPAGETYTIVKAISRKKQEVIDRVKKRFIKGFSKKTNRDSAKKIWKVIKDAGNYSFNAPHSVSVTGDSLYVALLKTMGPEVYASMLSVYVSSGKKDKIQKVKKEIKNKGLDIAPFRFGQDNREFNVDGTMINQNMRAIKYLNRDVANRMYEIRDMSSFIQFLEEQGEANSRQIKTLIKINYFEKFGDRVKLLDFYKLYHELRSRSVIKKRDMGDYNKQFQELIIRNSRETAKQYNDIDFYKVFKEYFNLMPNRKVDKEIIMEWELEILGNTEIKPPKGAYLVEVKSNKSWGKVWINNIHSSKPSLKVKCKKYNMKKGQFWFVRLEKYSWDFVKDGKRIKGSGYKVKKAKLILDK